MTTTTNLIELLRDKPDSDGICREAADFLEAQAKQIEALEAEWKPTPCEATLHACITYLLHGKADFSGLPEGLVNTFKFRTEALQADAQRYRVGREAAFAGLLVDFPHTKTWSDAMDFAYDQMIAARKGNV